MADTLPTIKVTHLESGDSMTINKSDFDPNIHERVESDRPARVKLKHAGKDEDKEPEKKDDSKSAGNGGGKK